MRGGSDERHPRRETEHFMFEGGSRQPGSGRDHVSSKERECGIAKRVFRSVIICALRACCVATSPATCITYNAITRSCSTLNGEEISSLDHRGAQRHAVYNDRAICLIHRNDANYGTILTISRPPSKCFLVVKRRSVRPGKSRQCFTCCLCSSACSKTGKQAYPQEPGRRRLQTQKRWGDAHRGCCRSPVLPRATVKASCRYPTVLKRAAFGTAIASRVACLSIVEMGT